MNLYTILIVDDESFIVDWLSNLLETQTDMNINVHGVYNSEKAVEIIEKTRIDLLISDIQMPMYNGFDLVEKVHRFWPSCKSILLTAYSDFEYAQQAIHHKVLSYILKTSTDNEILAEVKKALNLIQQERNQLSLLNNTERKLKDFQAKWNTQIFTLWINGYYASAKLDQAIETLGFHSTDQDRFMLILCQPGISSEDSKKQLQNLMLPFQLQRIMEHNLKPYITHSASEIIDELILYILQINSSVKNSAPIIRDALELVQNACSETLGLTTSYLVSPEGSAREIASFWSLGKNLLHKFIEESNFIYCYNRTNEDTSVTATETNPFLKSSYFTSLKRQLENGERESFMTALGDICKYLGQNTNWHDNVCLQIYFNLALVFISYINKKNIAQQVALHASTGMLFRPWLADSWQEIESDLYKMADTLFLLGNESQARDVNRIVEKVQDYIRSHIMEDISLLDLSGVTGYSMSYLSKYYSDSTGMTISEYIAQQKLRQITRLMLETDLNISEIASSMNFHSRTYFNNYMKRLTGMSPQQYKESLSNEDDTSQ